ncbi:MAG: methylenetetrahydrofolate--tRNA-(uracil(54)-C(5))-methyltransferase (FADH(2)-oxidizing) TrmFO [Nitrospirae bacterium]|nr:MAG: methylenetetrahydrofolate--tRNA-(uracil(54)-C(5))-methyltransferase (FADH(2)-oxidizing) TrmFO [Nitrospirota bacterium]
MRDDVVIIGGGLAGSEAAWQAANRGAKVTLYEMRPKEPTAAHKTGFMAELVCSNSLGSNEILSAPGILKEEMRRLGSLIIKVADEARVPAGAALAVDRDIFAQKITHALEGHPNVRILHEQVTAIPPDAVTIVATGPLTSDGLAEHLKQLTHAQHLYFFDAIAPIIDTDSVDMSIVFKASRYDAGEGDYLNCPMTEAEYDAFYQALLSAEKVVPKEFEKVPYFEGCLPVEVMAERGRDTMMFGPLKPVGLIDPRTQTRPYAVVQLRMENRHGTCYNMVGFQTKLTYGAQKRVFRTIPGLANAEFLRYGSVHRNTFINSPVLMRETLQLKTAEHTFLAGQLVGVEGYTEAAASGGLAGINAARRVQGQALVAPPETSAHGALLKYITTSDPRHFQPINTNYGLFPPLPARVRDKQERQRRIGQRALEDFGTWMQRSGLS